MAGIPMKVVSVGPGVKLGDARVLSGATQGAAIEQPALFNYQSYFDSVLQEKAILAQPPNLPIVPSTLTKLDVACYGVAALPTNQCPIAVRFKGGGASHGGSQVYRLKPGETLLPNDRSQFSGLEWGLPFGWLGGGVAAIRIFRAEDSTVVWGTDASEMIFHRTRIVISDSAGLPAAAKKNWPLRFPWPNAISGSNSLTQRGQPVMGVAPTRTLLRLRLAALAAPTNMRILFNSSNDFGVLSTGAIDPADVAAMDVTWGAWSQLGAGPGTQYQTMMLTDEMARIAADGGGVIFSDDGSGNLTGAFVDVVRYGRL